MFEEANRKTLGRFTIRVLIMVSAGAFVLFAALFGDMLKYNCQMLHVSFLCWFVAALVAAIAIPMVLWVGEGRHLKRVAIALAITSLLTIAIGGAQFILAFAQNEIVNCPDTGDADDNGQSYGA